jgi:exportin-T
MVRYSEFFKVRRDCLAPVLEAMVDSRYPLLRFCDIYFLQRSRGIHNTNRSFRLRLFYLFHRFIKENKSEVPSEICPNLSASVRDLLTIEVVLPNQDEIESDLLTEAVKDSVFESQLYLYETLGILCASFSKEPEQQTQLLLASVKPLMDELSTSLQEFSAKGSQDITPIVKTHHIVMALGNIAKGFPDFPTSTGGQLPVIPAADVFTEVAKAILFSLEVMNGFKVMRNAARFAFARILATAGPHVTHFIPTLMSHLLSHFEPTELVDFMNFIGLLIHKLERNLFTVLDELIGPLNLHISSLLTSPISGSDDLLAHADTKKAYLALLNNIMASKLHEVFVSPRK